ncbi:heptahelical transmembrane protein1 [Perilla frutescens var. frutescens]|nr:heptahelical transmembrane protein1 [Perilla frutescens var. frutescens]
MSKNSRRRKSKSKGGIINIVMDEDLSKDKSEWCLKLNRRRSRDDDEEIIVVSKGKIIRYPPLLSFNELPDYMKDNQYIFKYYRSEWPLNLAFLSLFRWHNETLNVWTHLIGLLLFVGLTVANAMHVSEIADFITFFAAQFPSSAEANVSNKFSGGTTEVIELKKKSSPKMEITTSKMSSTTTTTPSWPFYVFLCGSMFCLLCSSLCHLFCCHSRRLNTHLLNLDYVGITVMIITSFFPPMYYIFQCTPHWQVVYLTGITIMGACTIITLLTPALSSGKCRSFRVLLFVSMGLFGLIPAVHAAVVYWSDPHRNLILAYESVMALSYLIGTVFYVSRVPERWLPGWFDLAGQSHQIFHLFVLMGALAHYGAADIFLREVIIDGAEEHGIWFRVGETNIRFSPSEFALVTGLQFGASDFDPSVSYEIPRRSFYSRELNKTPLRVNDLLERFMTYSLGDDVMVANVLFLHTMIFGYDQTHMIDDWV